MSMEWVLDKKLDKICSLSLPIIISSISILLFLSITNLEVVNDWGFWLGIVIILFIIIFLEVILLKIGKNIENWDNPTIIRIVEDKVEVYERHNNGKKLKFVIDLNQIYKIIISKFKIVIWLKKDNRNYRWILLNIVESSANREKRFEILQEILKRIDKNNVEIIDKRRKTK